MITGSRIGHAPGELAVVRDGLTHDGLGCSQPDLAAARLRGVRGQLIGVQRWRQVGALGEGAPRRARLLGRQALRLWLGLGLA